MKRSSVVVLFSLVLVSLCSGLDTNSTQNSIQTNETNGKNQFNQWSNKEEVNENKLKATKLLEKALNLLDESNDKHNVKKAYSLLEESAQLNNLRAKELVVFSYLFGDPMPLNVGKAFEYLKTIPVNKSGRAHFLLGFIHSIGFGVKLDQKKALIHYRIAAQLNNPLAKMAIAFRFNHGLGIGKSCRKALSLYEDVSTQVVEDSQIMGGNLIVEQHLWLKKEQLNMNLGVIDRDLIAYYVFLTKGGDTKASVTLGELLFYGGYGVQKDRIKAFNYFKKAAETGNGNALAFLGKYYLEGIPPIKQNLKRAFELFYKSVEIYKNPIGMNELGLMYRYGRGVEVNFEKAFNYFKNSSIQGWTDAILQLGTMYLNGLGVVRDYRMAVKYLTLASTSKHLLANYFLAQLHSGGVGVMRSCSNALPLMKSVAERGTWSKMLTEANYDYENGYKERAFLKMALLSEVGYELAQSNTAFIVENDKINSLKYYIAIGPTLSLKYWTDSALQGSTYSRIKVGDYHYYGLGTPVDYQLAAHYYRKASEFRYSSQALFNLGYMNERGLGVERNLKMAKIYYQMSAQIDSNAKVPVFLAKTKLTIIESIENLSSFNLSEYFGEKWDLILIAILFIVLVIVLRFR